MRNIFKKLKIQEANFTGGSYILYFTVSLYFITK